MELQDDDWREFSIAQVITTADGGEYWLELEGKEYGSGDEEWTADVSDGEGEWLGTFTDRDAWPDYLPEVKLAKLKQYELWNLGGE